MILEAYIGTWSRRPCPNNLLITHLLLLGYQVLADTTANVWYPAHVAACFETFGHENMRLGSVFNMMGKGGVGKDIESCPITVCTH